jgi:hypothetical protein
MLMNHGWGIDDEEMVLLRKRQSVGIGESTILGEE